MSDLEALGIDPEQLVIIKRRAYVAVIEALFDHIAECAEDQWPLAVGATLAECKRSGMPFDMAWSMACEMYPPPDGWGARGGDRKNGEPNAHQFFKAHARVSYEEAPHDGGAS